MERDDVPTTVIYVVGEDRKLIEDSIDRFKEKVARRDLVEFLSLPKGDVCGASLKDDSKFLFVISKQQRCSIYDENDPAHSYYHQLNWVQKRRNTAIVIIVFNWEYDITSHEIHHSTIEDWWTIGSQGALKKFSDVLLTVKTSMNEKQWGVCQSKFGIELKEECQCWRCCRSFHYYVCRMWCCVTSYRRMSQCCSNPNRVSRLDEEEKIYEKDKTYYDGSRT